MIRIIKRLLKKYPTAIGVLSLLFLIENFLEALGIALVIPIFYKLFEQTNSGQISNAIDQLFYFLNLEASLANVLVALVIAFICKSVVMHLSRSMSAKTAGNYFQSAQETVFSRILSLKLEYFFNTKQGILINTLVQETTRAALTFLYTAQWISLVLTMVLYILMTMFISGWLVAAAALMAILSYLPLRFITKRCDDLGQENLHLREAIQSDLIEELAAIKLIKAQAKEREIFKKFQEKISKNTLIWYKTYFYSGATAIYSQPLGVLLLAIILYTGYQLSVPVAELLVFLFAFQRLLPTLSTLQNVRNNIATSYPGLEKIDHFLNNSLASIETSGKLVFRKLEHSITVKEVSFAYPNCRPLFSSLDLIIPKGKTVALLGGSGQGKTTLVDLLLGFYKVQKGEILLDTIPIEQVDLTSWRAKVAYVSQDTILFHNTLLENLRWGNHNLSYEEAINACKKAGAYEFIDKLEAGLNTIIGDRGFKLSGGQKQRIALARALAQKPEILILDEATSALDHETEVFIKETIKDLKSQGDLTIIMIAHRLTTIQDADIIYVLSDNKVVERGSWCELINTKDSYIARSLNLQEAHF